MPIFLSTKYYNKNKTVNNDFFAEKSTSIKWINFLNKLFTMVKHNIFVLH